MSGGKRILLRRATMRDVFQPRLSLRDPKLMAVLALVVAAGGMAGCGEDGGDADRATEGAAVRARATGMPTATGASTPDAPPTTPGAGRAATVADVDGRRFVLVHAPGRAIEAGREPTLVFDGKTLRASGGCNPVSGRYTVERGRLKQATGSSTSAACGGNTLDHDAWLRGVLDGDGASARIEGDGRWLVLSTQGQRLVFG